MIRPRVTRGLIILCFLMCMLSSIWSEDTLKWIFSGFYILAFGKMFGFMNKEESDFSTYVRKDKGTLDFTLIRNRK